MSPIKESDGDERWNWLRGEEEEEEDVESAYTASEEDPTVPSTPVEYDERENPDWVIQREDKLGILRLREYRSLLSFPPPSPTLENRVTEYRDPSSSFPGGARASTTAQAAVRSR